MGERQRGETYIIVAQIHGAVRGEEEEEGEEVVFRQGGEETLRIV